MGSEIKEEVSKIIIDPFSSFARSYFWVPLILKVDESSDDSLQTVCHPEATKDLLTFIKKKGGKSIYKGRSPLQKY